MLLFLVGPVAIANAFSLTMALAFLSGKTSGAWFSHPLVIAGTWYVARIEIFLLGLGMAVVIIPKMYTWLQRKVLLLRAIGWPFNQRSTQRVANKLDKDAWVPFAAHTEYWQNELFAKELYDAILSTP